MSNHLRYIGVGVESWLRRLGRAMVDDERGEGLVSFLIIAVAVAAIALYVLDVFEGSTVNKINQLDLGDEPVVGPGGP